MRFISSFTGEALSGWDEEDMADAGFIIRHDRITKAQLLEAFSQMKPIELAELRDAFERAKPVVLKLACDSIESS